MQSFLLMGELLSSGSGLLAAATTQQSALSIVGNLLTTGSYVALFGLLFACGLGLPLPEDIPLVISGVLVAQGRMDLALAGVVAWCGIIGGDILLYHFGKRYGLGITKVPFVGKHVTPERIELAERLFEKYGVWVVAIGRLFAGVRGAMVIAAGAVRYNLVKFLIADGLAAIVSGGLFLLLGRWFGKQISDIEDLQTLRHKVAGYEHILLAALIVVAVGAIVYIRFRRKKHVTLSDVVLNKATHHAVVKDADQHVHP